MVLSKQITSIRPYWSLSLFLFFPLCVCVRVHVCTYACEGVHMCVGGNTPLNTELSAMVSLNNQLALGTYAPGSAGRVPHSPSLSAP